MRSDDARCPFCDAPCGSSWGDVACTAGMSRRDVLALGAALAAAACRSPGGSHETSIVQPYGAPPTPRVPEASDAAAAPAIVWSLSSTGAALAMAARAQWRLQIAATNRGDATVNPQRQRLTFTLNGRPSMVTDMAFGNGAMQHAWLALAPGETVRDERALGESLFAAPGEYDIGMRYLDVEVANMHVRVTGPAAPTP